MNQTGKKNSKSDNKIQTHNNSQTNRILIDCDKQKIYLPGYFRLKFKNFHDLDIGSLSAQLNASIILTIYYGGLIKNDSPGEKKDKILRTLKNKIVLLFARDDAILLTQKDKEQKQLDIIVDHDYMKKQIKFSVKKIFHLYLDSDVFWSPFEIIHAMMEVTVQSVEIFIPNQKNQNQKWTVQFNLMDHKETNSKLSFSNWGTFGNYDLAQQKMRAFFTYYRVAEEKQFFLSVQQRIQKRQRLKKQQKQQKSKKPEKSDKPEKQDKVEAFHYAHFNIPLYKFPFSALATIFMPLWLLAILNLGIFFQDTSLADRVASVSAIMLALGALIPTIRQQIPPSPDIVFIEILVYAQSITTLLALVHSLDVRLQQQFQFVWYESALFLSSVIVTVITFIIIVILMAIHYGKWQPSYNLISNRRDKKQFQRDQWQSYECDEYFKRYFQFKNNPSFTLIQKKIKKKESAVQNEKEKEKEKEKELLKQKRLNQMIRYFSVQDSNNYNSPEKQSKLQESQKQRFSKSSIKDKKDKFEMIQDSSLTPMQHSNQKILINRSNNKEYFDEFAQEMK